MKNLKVIYIAGAGRSGSTIVDRVIGSVEGAASFNEVYRIWINGFIENQRCSCGETFAQCAFWKAVTAEAFGQLSRTEIQQKTELWAAVARTRHFLKLLSPIKSAAFKEKLREYQRVLNRLYFALAEVSGIDLIVDSSKLPAMPLILNDIPGIEVHVVHVVRDVRACVYAWQKKKENPGNGAFLEQYSPLLTTVRWMTRNFFASLLASRLPYIRVRYEDIMKNPQAELQALIDRIGPTAGKRLAWSADNTIELPSLHSFSGNPLRFNVGSTQLNLDINWTTRLHPGTRRLVTSLAYPLLVRYGYS
jgi:hypothetical protein